MRFFNPEYFASSSIIVNGSTDSGYTVWLGLEVTSGAKAVGIIESVWVHSVLDLTLK